ncbi:MAG: SCO family protein [Alphaproteobacteria bacterium]
MKHDDLPEGAAGGPRGDAPAPTAPAAPPRVALRLLGLFSLIAAAVLFGWLSMPGREAPELPVISEIGDFELVDASGKPVGRRTLEGQPWVADLVFTSCSGICPAMSQEMKRLQDQTTDLPDLKLVSISVDPAVDTPEALERYAARFGADRSRWLFLTGDASTIRRLANDGMKLAAVDGDPAKGDEAIVHSPRFALVDGRGRVRGTYDMRDPEAMLRLRGDLRVLVSREGKPAA